VLAAIRSPTMQKIDRRMCDMLCIPAKYNNSSQSPSDSLPACAREEKNTITQAATVVMQSDLRAYFVLV
jgi:hypothetical protein